MAGDNSKRDKIIWGSVAAVLLIGIVIYLESNKVEKPEEPVEKKCTFTTTLIREEKGENRFGKSYFRGIYLLKGIDKKDKQCVSELKEHIKENMGKDADINGLYFTFYDRFPKSENLPWDNMLNTYKGKFFLFYLNNKLLGSPSLMDEDVLK